MQCNSVQKTRRKLDSLSTRGSFFSCRHPRICVSQTPRLIWRKWWRNPGASWRKTLLAQAQQDDTSAVSKKAAYNLCKTVQSRLRDMQDSWLSKKAEEIQCCADRKDTKKFHDALKQFMVRRALEPPHYSVQMEAHFWHKDAIFERWTEHFNSVLIRSSTINDNAINRLPQVECNVLLDEFPTVTETTKAIQHLSSGKAPGSDIILRDLLSGKSTNGRQAYRIVSLHVEEGGYPTRIQGCIYNPPIQAERKCSRLWQPQGHLSIVDCWEDTGKTPAESPERATWSG